jgi:WS/DGAT/MGAT family acyltransferase
MKRLGGTDALFLSMETPSWHQHIAGLTVLDPEGRSITFDDVVKRIEERIVYAPKFRWKLQEVPFGLDRPVWVDDPEFDVRRHVRHLAVPAPGGAREVGELVGQLASTQLDRRRPLWELFYIEGLAGGKVGLMMKYHHCLLDGVAGASLATVLLDLEPDATAPLMPPPPADELSAGPAESGWKLLADSIKPDLRRPARLARYASGMAAKGIAAVNSVRNDEENRALLRAPQTPFNAPIGPRRELSFSSVAMADVLKLKEAHGVKVNDVVLALCGGALRRYLEHHDALPDAPLVTAVPVSTRAVGDLTQDNQITNMFVSLATDIDDPGERLNAINRSTMSAKAMTKAIGARQIQSIGEVAAPLILSTAIRAAYRTQLMSRSPVRVNTLVSNVPGPPMALYMCGARVTAIYPSSVILEGMGLNITVISYQDRLDFGLHVDPDLVSDPWFLAGCIGEALVELLDASGLGAPTPVEEPLPVDAPVDAAPEAPTTKAAASRPRAARKPATKPAAAEAVSA